jgi:hypothetical protein
MLGTKRGNLHHLSTLLRQCRTCLRPISECAVDRLRCQQRRFLSRLHDRQIHDFVKLKSWYIHCFFPIACRCTTRSPCRKYGKERGILLVTTRPWIENTPSAAVLANWCALHAERMWPQAPRNRGRAGSRNNVGATCRSPLWKFVFGSHL